MKILNPDFSLTGEFKVNSIVYRFNIGCSSDRQRTFKRLDSESLSHDFIRNISNTVFDHISKHREDRKYENTTRSEECLTNFELIGNEVKTCLDNLIYLLNQTAKN